MFPLPGTQAAGMLAECQLQHLKRSEEHARLLPRRHEWTAGDIFGPAKLAGFRLDLTSWADPMDQWDDLSLRLRLAIGDLAVQITVTHSKGSTTPVLHFAIEARAEVVGGMLATNIRYGCSTSDDARFIALLSESPHNITEWPILVHKLSHANRGD